MTPPTSPTSSPPTSLHINTTRFGLVEVTKERIITFDEGLVGFESAKKYVILEPDDPHFNWLQCTTAPDLAFVVTEPTLWFPSYGFRIDEASIRAKHPGLAGINSENALLLAIVNKHLLAASSSEESLTLNLQGPLVINAQTRHAAQIVLSSSEWSTRHYIRHQPESREGNR